MATVLDTLIIELGLDPTAFERGQKDAARAMLKTRDEVVKNSKEMEHEVGDKLSEAFREATRHAVEFIAALAGARGLVDFAASATAAGVSLSLMSTMSGVPVQRLSEIENAFRKMNGSAEGVASSLGRLKSAQVALREFGVMPNDQTFRLISNVGNASAEEMMLSIPANLDRANIRGSSDRTNAVMQTGMFDADTARIIATHSAAQLRPLIDAEKGNATTKEQAEAAERLAAAWANASISVTHFGDTVFEKAEGPLSTLLDHVAKLVEKNGAWMAGWIGDKITAFDDYLENHAAKDWDDFSKKVQSGVDKVNAFAKALGGWQTVGEALLALWTTEKFSGVIGLIGKLAAALTGLGTAAGGGLISKLLGILGNIPAAAAALGAIEAYMIWEGGHDSSGFQEQRDMLRRSKYFKGETSDDLIHQRSEMEHMAGRGLPSSYSGGFGIAHWGDVTFGGGKTVTEATPLPVTLAGEVADTFQRVWNMLSGGSDAPAGGTAGGDGAADHGFGWGADRGGGGWNKAIGPIPSDVMETVRKNNPNLSPAQCVALIEGMGLGNVQSWRRGTPQRDAPDRTPLATFGWKGESDRYALGGIGTPGIGRDHGVYKVKGYPDGSFDAVSQDVGHGPHLIHIPWTGKGGEGDASAYFVPTHVGIQTAPIRGGARHSPAVTDAKQHQSSIAGKTSVVVGSVTVTHPPERAAMSDVERRLRARAIALEADVGLV